MTDFEVAPGVVIAFGGEDSGVYISDREGEVVCWIYDEIHEDPEAWTASLRAVAIAARLGPRAVRAFLKSNNRERIVELLERRKPLWDEFQARGGRGVELADEIDEIDAELERLDYDD